MTDALSSPQDDDLERPPAPGDVLAGKYRVESVVGAGGMGIVVAAQHLTLGQTVAVKLLRIAGLDEERRTEARARFLREGQAAARLASEHVVRIHDVGTLDDGAPFMVMELLRGNDLATVIDGPTRIPVELAVEYVIQVCDAVGEAHTHGIVHRDLKPSNLFVTKRSDGRPLVKVLDFGISKAIAGADDPLQGNLTSTRSVVGSPYYMSPEQVRDAKRVDARSDLWSLGMILYEILVGEPAFNADTLPGICAAIAADTPPPIGGRRPDVPPELEAIVMRCLEKDPARRFQTVVELVRALAPFAAHSAGVSTADYASRRLEESVQGVHRPGRIRPDEATIHSGPDSGLRLSDRGGGEVPPSVEPVSAPSTAMPAVLRADTRTMPSPGPEGPPKGQSTLVSRTGTSLPSPAERAERAEVDEGGMIARSSTTERNPLTRRSYALLVLLALLVVAGVLFTVLRKPPPAQTEETAPRGHEPVGPAPELNAPPPLPPTHAVSETTSKTTVPSETPPAAALAPSATTATAKPPSPKRPLPKAPAPKPTTPAPKPATPDIRLER